MARSMGPGGTIAKESLCLDVPLGVFFLELPDDKSNNEPLTLVDLPSDDDEDEESRHCASPVCGGVQLVVAEKAMRHTTSPCVWLPADRETPHWAQRPTLT